MKSGVASSKSIRYALFVAAALLAYSIPLLHFDTPLQFDWNYFNSLSLVTRSSVLGFGRFPLHDPWTLGGNDLLANPQSRVLSPLFLIDLLLAPPQANLFSFVILAFGGLLGMYALLRDVHASRLSSMVGAVLFINCNWFGLHAAEGHIAFGSLQLLPWIAWSARGLLAPRRLFTLCSFMAFFLLDGGMYSFGLSVVLVLAILLSGWGRRGLGKASSYRGWGISGIGCMAAAFLAAGKLIPMMRAFSDRTAVALPVNIPLRSLAGFLFDLRASPLRALDFPTILRFHEFGCYWGLISTGLVLVVFFNPRFFKEHWREVALVALFLWMGAGWGDRINPWTLFERLPLLGNLRVQSRVFILMELFFIVLLVHALDKLFRKYAWGLALVPILLIESVIARNYPFVPMYHSAARAPGWPVSVLRWSDWQGTFASGTKPDHYFQGSRGGLATYEPVQRRTAVQAIGTPDYRGEIYPLLGAGSFRILSYTPGQIRIGYDLPGDLGDPRSATWAVVNTNFLDGWETVSGNGQAYRTPDDLLGLRFSGSGSGEVTVIYRPVYRLAVIGLTSAGWLAWLWALAVLIARADSGFRLKGEPSRSEADDQRPPAPHGPSAV